MGRDDAATEGYVDTTISETLEEILPAQIRRAVREEIVAGLGNGIRQAICDIVTEELEPLRVDAAKVHRLLYGEGEPSVDLYRPGLISVALSLNQQTEALRAQGRLLRWLLPLGTASGIGGLIYSVVSEVT